MKYFLWAFIFFAYILMTAGLFLIIGSIFKGTEIAKTDTFNLIVGFTGLFISLGGGYAAADFVSKAWYSENPDEPDKKRDIAKWVVFAVIFTVIFMLFRLHDSVLPGLFPNVSNLYLSIRIGSFRIPLHSIIQFFVLPFEVDEAISLLSLRGLLFTAITITLTYVFTKIVYKRMSIEMPAGRYGIAPQTPETENGGEMR